MQCQQVVWCIHGIVSLMLEIHQMPKSHVCVRVCALFVHFYFLHVQQRIPIQPEDGSRGKFGLAQDPHDCASRLLQDLSLQLGIRSG